jgi:hypothetical protein
MAAPACNYCGKVAKLVRGNELYPHRLDLRASFFWACTPCGAWVGCHPGTAEPLGRLANAELRKWKQQVHGLFDPIWKQGTMTRSQAYQWLATGLGITGAECHVGMFDVMRCQHAVAFINNNPQPRSEANAKPMPYWRRQFAAKKRRGQ